MKYTFKFVTIGIIGAFFLNSCNTTNDVVSSGLMSKRKYNKGFHFNNNLRSLNLAKTPSKEKINFIDQIVIDNKIPTSEYQDFTEVKNEVLSKEAFNNTEKENKVIINYKPSQQKLFKNKETINLSTFENKKFRNEIIENTINAKKTNYRELQNNSDIEKLLLIILCFLLPPLAVFLFKGSWTMEVTISVILTLFFWVPGIIYALYVILV